MIYRREVLKKSFILTLPALGLLPIGNKIGQTFIEISEAFRGVFLKPSGVVTAASLKLACELKPWEGKITPYLMANVPQGSLPEWQRRDILDIASGTKVLFNFRGAGPQKTVSVHYEVEKLHHRDLAFAATQRLLAAGIQAKAVGVSGKIFWQNWQIREGFFIMDWRSYEGAKEIVALKSIHPYSKFRLKFAPSVRVEADAKEYVDSFSSFARALA